MNKFELKLEAVRLKLRKYYIRYTHKKRRKKINYDNFTIISNNCWGGLIYQSYGIKYSTPTIGVFFLADDYIKFVYNIREYLKYELEFIKPEEAKRYKITGKLPDFPVGKLNDIEIYFMHYKTEEEAREKWQRRSERINWDKIIFKFSNQNFCEKKHIEEFMQLPEKNKICFVSNKEYNIKGTIFIRQFIWNKNVKASYEPYGNDKRINMNEYINKL